MQAVSSDSSLPQRVNPAYIEMGRFPYRRRREAILSRRCQLIDIQGRRPFEKEAQVITTLSPYMALSIESMQFAADPTVTYRLRQETLDASNLLLQRLVIRSRSTRTKQLGCTLELNRPPPLSARGCFFIHGGRRRRATIVMCVDRRSRAGAADWRPTRARGSL